MRNILLSLLVSVSGCSSLKPLSGNNENILGLLSVGDRIVILTSDQKKHKMKVEEIGEDYVIGSDIKIYADQIQDIHIREQSSAKTFGVIVVGLLVILGIGEWLMGDFEGMTFREAN